MVKNHVSDKFQLLDGRGHKNYDFVDIAVNNDNLLFIDPVLIELGKDIWSKDASKYVESYFNMLFEAYYKEDRENIRNLLSHAGEQNATRLGYGKGDNGKGNTAKGLIETFKPLERLIVDIKSVERVEDLTILIPGFAEDGLSDLLTNILHKCLNDFTVAQMSKQGIYCNGELEFYTWDVKLKDWVLVKRPSYLVDGKELLLVPKWIVRSRYLFGVNQYFTRIILERMLDEGWYRDLNGNTIPKKEIIKSKRFSGEHWIYNESVKYTAIHNDALDEYHRKILGFYIEHGKPMSDELLDLIIY